MPFEPTTEDLRLLLVRALNEDKDLAEGANEAGLNEELLLGRIGPRANEIWEAGASQQNEVDRLQREYDLELDEKVNRALEVKATRLRLFRRLWPVILVALPLAVLLIRYFEVSRFNLYLISTRPVWQLITGVVILLSVVFGIYNSQKESYEKDLQGKRQEFEEEKEFVDKQTKISEAKKLRDDAVITQGIKPHAKEIYEQLVKRSFSRHLPELEVSGLSEVFNTANEIATAAKRELEFMLKTMPGGSIGIAGPRGSGKSTLLKSACADLPGNLEKRQVISLLTTSPVEYQGRDFILHLFSSMCTKVLEKTTRRMAGHSTWDDVLKLRRPETVSIFRTLWPLAPLALVLGSVFMGLGIVLAVVLMNTPAPVNEANKPAAGNAQPAASTPSPAQDPQASPTPAPTRPGLFVRIVQALDLKPGVFFISGFLMMVFYLVMRFYLVGVNQFNLRYAPDPDTLIEAFALEPDVKTRLYESNEQARRWLREIKFQQSYTSGWAGNLKLPIGLEGGVNTAVSLAQQQLTLPDITGAFSSFLDALGRDFKVIIGIDELDKLESDDAAQRFLNEIKAVFGISNVFYLISVSENAMSSFERRGMPFRDVFDSSFDNIIYVEYLKLEQAKRLIARRVRAMPPPFVHLCYCISGGLARDLVRVCRNLMQHSQKAFVEDPAGAGSNLGTLTGILIRSDLALKLQALTVVAKKLAPGPRLSAFLDEVHSLEGKLESPKDLLEAYIELLKGAKSVPTEGSSGNGATGIVELYDKLKQRLSGDVPNAAEGKTLNSLHEELASYIYYCVTLLEFFSTVIDDAKLTQCESNKTFDHLARARQYLAINPAVTRSMVDKFRADFKMTVPSMPSTPAAVVTAIT